jgi:hypothetical protein
MESFGIGGAFGACQTSVHVFSFEFIKLKDMRETGLAIEAIARREYFRARRFELFSPNNRCRGEDHDEHCR